MAAYTEHYGLHQWAATDNFLRTDFNADHLLIDSGIKAAYDLAVGKSKVIFGTYLGDGEEERTFDLGVAPKWILVMPGNGHIAGYYSTGIATQEHPVIGPMSKACLQLNGTMLTVGFLSNGPWTNETDRQYHYIAAV